jgi:hypothetical protein
MTDPPICFLFPPLDGRPGSLVLFYLKGLKIIKEMRCDVRSIQDMAATVSGEKMDQDAGWWFSSIFFFSTARPRRARCTMDRDGRGDGKEWCERNELAWRRPVGWYCNGMLFEKCQNRVTNLNLYIPISK